MRDCIFLVADKNMEAAFGGFLGRDQFHSSLGTAPFTFDPDVDLLVDEGGSDPGVFRRAHEILRSYTSTHRHAVVALDCDWAGSPGAEAIVSGISDRLRSVGWKSEYFAVIAIDPEIEAWMWQDSPHVSSALWYRKKKNLRRYLQENDRWPKEMGKPPSPKEAMEWVLRGTRRRRSSQIYREITSEVSVRQCQDGAFQELADRLRLWFPEEGE